MALPTLAYWVKRQTPENYVASIRQGLSGTVAGVTAHLSRVARSLDPKVESIDAIVAEREAILRAFSSRWNGSVPPTYRVPSTLPPADLVERLTSGRMPWFQSGKDALRQKESQWVSQRLFELESLMVDELRSLASMWSRTLPVGVQSPASQPPALIIGIEDYPNRLDRASPGEGPLVLQVGEAAWALEVAVPHLGGASPTGLTTQSLAGLPPANPFAMLVNLVQDGGFATDHRTTVESAVVRLLALLPAGQLKVHLFDPVKVGASLKFLSDLGDATRAAIADVRVVAADLEPLLDDLTRHVARVTQQYLGSRHNSLAEYNRAAGEVAEAYHLLVLMDFPTGRVDDDVLRKLDTLVKAGPACGVFTLILSSDPGRFSFGLPVLRNEVWEDPTHMIWDARSPADTPERVQPCERGQHSVEGLASVHLTPALGVLARVSMVAFQRGRGSPTGGPPRSRYFWHQASEHQSGGDSKTPSSDAGTRT